MKRLSVAALLAVAVLVSGCWSAAGVAPGTVRGSGRVVNESRTLRRFTSVVLKSSADLYVAFGEQSSVAIEADDNIVPLIQTEVHNGQLVVNTRAVTSVSPTRPIRVNVTTESLESISLRGSGNIKVSDLEGDALELDLPGSGTITVTGVLDRLDISVGGSGDVVCSGLEAKTVAVSLRGSGNVTVHAIESLDATISGSGVIRYGGNPATVHRSITGSGYIGP